MTTDRTTNEALRTVAEVLWSLSDADIAPRRIMQLAHLAGIALDVLGQALDEAGIDMDSQFDRRRDVQRERDR